MRLLSPAALLLSTLLAACASTDNESPAKPLDQSGPLRVHPGLLGRPVPAEWQDSLSAGSSAEATAIAETPIRLDETGLRAQRSVYFEPGSALPNDDFQPLLQAHGRYLAAHPGARVRIEGHADERDASNNATHLGRQRAENVRRALLAQGAAEKQVGIQSPTGSAGHDETSLAENRRADIVYEN